MIFDVVAEECNFFNTKSRFSHLEYDVTFFAAHEEGFETRWEVREIVCTEEEVVEDCNHPCIKVGKGSKYSTL